MNPTYQELQERLRASPQRWIVTGAAGFIGSHLVEALLRTGQKVIGIDNFITGHRHNLDDVRNSIPDAQWRDFRFVETDIRDAAGIRDLFEGVSRVLHQAALGSVPRSISDPQASHSHNVDGFFNLLEGARAAGVEKFVYASSSSVYGDDAGLPKREGTIGNPLSPYAATKRANEVFAATYWRCFGFPTVGLRYFNVFGPRQDPEGAYAAVIPKWIAAFLENREIIIHGDGETSRDFCYIDNVVEANLRAAETTDTQAFGRAFNVAVGARTSLNEVFLRIQKGLSSDFPHVRTMKPRHGDFRAGDITHSQADITLAKSILGYKPVFDFEEGIERTLLWHKSRHRAAAAS